MFAETRHGTCAWEEVRSLGIKASELCPKLAGCFLVQRVSGWYAGAGAARGPRPRRAPALTGGFIVPEGEKVTAVAVAVKGSGVGTLAPLVPPLP